jgi:hypothetical protein
MNIAYNVLSQSNLFSRRRNVVKKILLIASHPAGGNIIATVGQALAIGNKVEVVVLGHEFSVPILKETGTPFKTIGDFGIPSIWLHLLLLVVNFLCRFFPKLEYYSQKIVNSYVSVKSIQALLGRINPDLIVLGTTAQDGKLVNTLEYSITLAARSRGIPTIAVMDTWMEGSEAKLFTDIRTGLPLDVLPDIVAVIDQRQHDAMIKEGFPAERLKITGQPYFDSLVEESKSFTESQRQQIRQAIGLDCQTLILFSANAFSLARSEKGYCDLDVLKIMASVLPQLDGVGMAVKLHMRTPDGDKAEISQFIKQAGVNMKLVDGIHPRLLSLAADLTIVEFSTLGNEAVYMRRPTMSFQPGLLGDDLLFVSNHDIIPLGHDAKTCTNLLVGAVKLEFRQALLRQSAGFTTDDQATNRVVELAYSLLKD